MPHAPHEHILARVVDSVVLSQLLDAVRGARRVKVHGGGEHGAVVVAPLGHELVLAPRVPLAVLQARRGLLGGRVWCAGGVQGVGEKRRTSLRIWCASSRKMERRSTQPSNLLVSPKSAKSSCSLKR